MALVIKDRVKETSTTTGTGTLTLAGATTGYQSFSTAIGNGNTTYYTISTPTGSEWEVGLGTVGAGTLARTTILASSNSGSAVNFSAGSKDVFGTYPAGKAVYSDIESDITINGLRVGKGVGAVATNTAVGFQAINATATGTQNTGVGYQSLAALTSGGSNTSLGHQALAALTTGSNNTAVGRAALQTLTTSSNNTALGWIALNANTSGTQNTGLGAQALQSNTTGVSNLAIGYQPLLYNTTGGNNVAVGNSALIVNISGNTNTTVGNESLNSNTTGANNVAVGYQALNKNTASVATLGAISNGGTGYNGGASGGPLTVQASLSSGTAVAANGTYPTLSITVTSGVITAATLVTNGTRFVDTTTVLTVTSAAMVTAGFAAGGSGFTIPVATLATGANNTAVGYQALNANTTASQNTALGYRALASTTTAANNTAVGYGALVTNTTGTGNTSLGSGASLLNLTGINNTAVGYQALNTNSIASYNNAFGNGTLYNATAQGNNAFGTSAGGAISSGTYNVCIGHQAGYSGTNNLTTGANNIIIGYNAAASSATVSNEITLGNSSITTVRIPGVGFTATTNGFGYATGSGGAVTQATSRTTGVTLNKTNGAITLVSAAGLATYQSFTVTNSTVVATDTIIVNQKSGTDKYIILVTNVAAGSFEITFATTGGVTTEQPVFNFAVIKAVTA